MMRKLFFLFSLLAFFSCREAQIDVLVIGGGTGGTTAGIQAARMGSKTVIAEEFDWLGGMLTSAGVSAVDGNYMLSGGLWGEYKNALINHYGGVPERLQTGWVSAINYEPSVGDSIFKALAAAEKKLDVWYKTTLVSAEREKNHWKVVLNRNGVETTVTTRILVDGTDLGDVAKLCGVKYDVGMESRSATQETIAPEQANDIIQDMTYVAVLKDYGKDVTIPEPEGYDPSLYYCACEGKNCVQPKEPNRMHSPQSMITYGLLPNQKYMINWPIEGNDYYLNTIEMTPAERTEALKAAKNHTLGFVYYLQTELGFRTLGLADDEFPTTDKLPFYPYYREGRRIHGLVRFTLNDLANPYDQKEKLYRTGIAVGDYAVDHHHGRYAGSAELPDLHFYPVPAFTVPLGALIPQQVDGLIMADKAISVSNLANGATRLQPVILQVGQAAGALAALSVSTDKPVREVSIRQVQEALLNGNSYLMPIKDFLPSSPYFKSVQRICATGILKGRGVSQGWANQMMLDADMLLNKSDLVKGLAEFYPQYDTKWMTDELVSIYDVMKIAYTVMSRDRKADFQNSKRMMKHVSENWEKWGLTDYNELRPVKKYEFAVLFDQLAQPFSQYDVTATGETIGL